MTRLNNPPNESARCPFCASAMYRVYVKTNGGIWFHESSNFMDEDFDGNNSDSPLHCIIGTGGYTKGQETWPKDGFFCPNCNTTAIKK